MKANTNNTNNILENLTVKVRDMCIRSEQKSTPYFTGFLSPEEQVCVLKEAKEHRGIFVLCFGGFEGAERKVAGIFPHDCYKEPETADEEEQYEQMAELSYVKIEGSGFVNIGHRDVLGSVMSLGLKREMLGDIIITEDSKCAYMPVKETSAEYICANLERVARDKVRVKLVEKTALPEKKQKFSDMVLTVSSVRLDGLVSAMTGLSRDKAKKLIASGKVALNHLECTSCDSQFYAGDIVTVKGEGKFYVEDFLGLTSKEKHRIVVRKYI